MRLPLFVVVESASYYTELETIGDVRRLDEALEGVDHALERDPGVYPPLINRPRFRVATTDIYEWDGGIIPALDVLFEIDGCYVKKLAVRIADLEDETWV